MASLQSYWKKNGVPNDVQVQMGIATGFCTIGNFGSDQRLEYTALGSPVNLAARLQDMAVAETILVDQSTLSPIGQHIISQPKGVFTPKGFAREVQYFQIDGLADTALFRAEGELSHIGNHVEVNLFNSSDIRVAIEEPADIQKNFAQQIEHATDDAWRRPCRAHDLKSGGKPISACSGKPSFFCRKVCTHAPDQFTD